MELKKAEFITKVATIGDFTKKDAENAINSVLSAITATLAEGDSVKIAGFGTFYMKKLPPKNCRNFQTGETVEMPERFKPAFKVGKSLKEIILK